MILWFYIFYTYLPTCNIRLYTAGYHVQSHAIYARTCNNAALTALIAVAAAVVAEDTPTEVTGDTPTTEALLVSGECTSANSGTDVTER